LLIRFNSKTKAMFPFFPIPNLKKFGTNEIFGTPCVKVFGKRTFISEKLTSGLSSSKFLKRNRF